MADVNPCYPYVIRIRIRYPLWRNCQLRVEINLARGPQAGMWTPVLRLRPLIKSEPSLHIAEPVLLSLW